MGKSKTKKLSEEDSLKETMKAVNSFEKRRSQKFRDSSSDSDEKHEILTQSSQKRKRKSSSSSSSSEGQKPKMKKPAIFTVSMNKKGSSKQGSFLGGSSDSSSDEELPKTNKSSKQLFPEKFKRSKKHSSSSSDSSEDNSKKSKIKLPLEKTKISKSFAESSDDDSDSSEDEREKIKEAQKKVAKTGKPQKSFNDTDSSSDDDEIKNKKQIPSKTSKIFKSSFSKEKKREESSDSDSAEEKVVQKQIMHQSSSASDSSDDEKSASSKKISKLTKKVGDVPKSSSISPKKKESPVKINFEVSSSETSESDEISVSKSKISVKEQSSQSSDSEKESEKHVSFLEAKVKEKKSPTKKETKEKKASPKKTKDITTNFTSPKVKQKLAGPSTPDISKKKMIALQRQTMHFYEEEKPMAVAEDAHFAEIMKPTTSSGKTLLCISLPKGFDVRVLNGQTLHLPGRDAIDEKKQTTRKVPGSNWQFDVIPLQPSEAPNVLVKNKKDPGFTITPPISYLVDVRKKLNERTKTTADKPQPKKIKKEVPKDLKMRNVVNEKESKSPKKKGEFVSSTPINGKAANKPDEEILKLSSIGKSKKSYPSEEEGEILSKKEKKKKKKAKESISGN